MPKVSPPPAPLYSQSRPLCVIRQTPVSWPAVGFDSIGHSNPGRYATMVAARHLRPALALALALILGLSSASKRPRSEDSSDSGQDESSESDSAPATTTIAPTTLSSVSAQTDPVLKDASLHFLKRAIQITGCLFSDPTACSGDFDDPTGYAALLLGSVFVKKHPKYEPARSLGSDLCSVDQLRNELVKQSKTKRNPDNKLVEAGADELRLVAARQLIDSASWVSSERSLGRRARSTIKSWEATEASNALASPALSEVFMAAEKATARFDRSVFVWPAEQSSRSPLYPEERLYAVAVVLMCKRLGVKPVSVFLFTKAFDSSLPLDCPYWRRSTIQVIAMAADKSVQGLDLAELCRSFVGQLGISEKLEFIPNMKQRRRSLTGRRRLKLKPPSIPAQAVPAKPPMPSAPPKVLLPTALLEDYAGSDRLLLVRSMQVACLIGNQSAVDHRGFGNIFFQASNVIVLLLKASGQNVSSELKLGLTPLDLLRVIAEADRRPDLGAVSTVGDVMIAAAQTIFRHLYLTLPITDLIKVETFSVVGSPGLHFLGLSKLKDVLLHHGAPYVLGDSSTLTELYEATDAILWAAFRITSKRRGSLNEAFVLCTQEMGEKISIAQQHLDYLTLAVLRRVLGSSVKSIEAAVLDLISQIAPVSKTPSSVQVPRDMPRAPVATPKSASVSNQTDTAIIQTAYGYPRGGMGQVAITASQIAKNYSRQAMGPVLSKVVMVMKSFLPDGIVPIRSLSDIPYMVLPFLRTDLTKAWELASSNRLVTTLQLQNLDDKLKRDRIPFSDTDHVTVLLDALVALHLLQQGAVFKLAGIPRTRMSDIGTADKGNLTLLLVAALFKATSMQAAVRSTAAAFSELTRMLANAVKATASNS